MYTGGRY